MPQPAASDDVDRTTPRSGTATPEGEASHPEPVRDAEARPPLEGGVLEREFVAEGESWTARIVGSSAYGAGLAVGAPLSAIRFRRAGEADPSREILVARGRFAIMHETELRELLGRATPIGSAGRQA